MLFRSVAALGATIVFAVPAPSVAASRAVPAADHEISFSVYGTTTYGTLHIPAHQAGRRLPAALLLPGSGPTDRNGNQPPTLTPNTLGNLASALGADGIATFRFDKYGTGRTGLGAFTGHPENLDYQVFVRQADAAYRVLSSQPQVDSRSVRLIGHSEGAMTALVVAATARPRPAGIALLQPQAMRLLDVISRQIHDQLGQAAAAGQLTQEQKRAASLAVDRAVADFRAHRPVDTTSLLPPIAALFQSLEGTNRRFVESDDLVEPAQVAQRLRAGTPVLLTCGTADPQVPCDTTEELTAALRHAHTRGPGRVTLPGVGHNLDDATHPGGIAPSALAALRTWLKY